MKLDTSDLFKRRTVKKAEDLEKQGRTLEGYVFRGHKDPNDGLTTTLHLACKRHGLLQEAPDIERKLLREFARRAHLYMRDGLEIPDPGDTLEWISLMRHYGAPTRVLDWTYSIFVAAHFALSASERNKACYIWAIDPEKLNKRAGELNPGLRDPIGSVQKSGSHFRSFFMARPQKAFVATATPYRLNERLAIQHGVFLCPGHVGRSFLDNLRAIDLPKSDAIEIEIQSGCRGDLRELLHRQNIDSEVLFPGLQGLAMSLRDRIPELDKAHVEAKDIDLTALGRAAK
ncbi:MAG TPA: FRG domain-containing protein [Nitrospiraceae bacterium]|jgi:hypothetical protein